MHDFQRTLTFDDRDGPRPIELLVYAPVPSERIPGRWQCDWSLEVLHPERGWIYGEDPLDAFMQCAHFIGGLLQGFDEDGCHVWWRWKGDGGGLAVDLFFKLPEADGDPKDKSI
jgi:hypothetical protein